MIRHEHDPVRCILPPNILERIAQHGDADQRRRALHTLARDTSLRAIRSQNSILRAQGAKQIGTEAPPEGGTPQRTIFDCANSEDLASSTVARSEGDGPTGDVTVNEAYDGLGATYRLFWDIYQRDSIDDEGMPLKGYVHYGDAYDNAFWDGQEMVFGDGDGRLFNRFTIAVDIMGHELAHGVTEDEAQLVYFRQAGALNEHYSDVAGSLVKQYQLNQRADEADWLIGAGLIAGAEDQALRSMKAPGTAFDHPLLGKDPQPDHMDRYVQTMEDNGGVHINSGIPNHAFYLAATIIGGYAWEVAGRIWYETMRDPRLKPTCQFRTYARITLGAAQRLGYGTSSDEYKAVKEAWHGVGIDV
jgi:Zn-dependent metalloprotease